MAPSSRAGIGAGAPLLKVKKAGPESDWLVSEFPLRKSRLMNNPLVPLHYRMRVNDRNLIPAQGAAELSVAAKDPPSHLNDASGQADRV